MTSVSEGAVTLTFDESWTVLVYESLSYYRLITGLGGSNKAVDVVAYDPDRGDLWLIEIKDYRLHRREKPVALVKELAMKVRDTLGGLVILRVRAGGDYPNHVARILKGMKAIRVVLHIEQPAVVSRFRQDMVDPKTLRDLLVRELKRVDNGVRAVSQTRPQVGDVSALPWGVSVGST